MLKIGCLCILKPYRFLGMVFHINQPKLVEQFIKNGLYILKCIFESSTKIITSKIRNSPSFFEDTSEFSKAEYFLLRD